MCLKVNNGGCYKSWTTVQSDSSCVSEIWDTNVVGYETGKVPENNRDILETESPCVPDYYDREQDEQAEITSRDKIPHDERLVANIENLYDAGKDDLDVEDIEKDASTDVTDDTDMFLVKEKLHLSGLKLVDSKNRNRNIDQSTLAQVALSVVMEGDERCASPSSCWFEGDTCTQRRRTTSLNEADLSPQEKQLEIETTRDLNRTSQDSIDSLVSTSDYKSKKALGHTRSKSDGTTLIKTTTRQHSVKEIPRAKEQARHVPESQSRLSSSLPESSGIIYG